MEVRQQRLEDSVSWFKFSHEIAELRDWMLDLEKVVDSEDCGTDLEHAQMLLNKFEDFARDLVSSEDRVVAINDMGQEVIEAGHSQAQVQIKLFNFKKNKNLPLFYNSVLHNFTCEMVCAFSVREGSTKAICIV